MKELGEIFFDIQTIYDQMSPREKIKTFNIRTIDKFKRKELEEVLTGLKESMDYSYLNL